MASQTPIDDPRMDAAMNDAMSDALNAALDEAGLDDADVGVSIDEEELVFGPEVLSDDGMSGVVRTLGVALGGLALVGGLIYVGVRVLRQRGAKRTFRLPGLRVEVRPRAAVFAPTLTIALPFSSVIERRRARRGARRGMASRPMRGLGERVSNRMEQLGAKLPQGNGRTRGTMKRARMR